MGHGLLKKVNFHFIFSEKLIFRGKCHQNARIMLNAFASLNARKNVANHRLARTRVKF